MTSEAGDSGVDSAPDHQSPALDDDWPIDHLEDDTKAKLQRLTRQHGRSTEEEVRDILRNAVRTVDDPPQRLGSRISSRFTRVGLTGEIPELRGQAVQP